MALYGDTTGLNTLNDELGDRFVPLANSYSIVMDEGQESYDNLAGFSVGDIKYEGEPVTVNCSYSLVTKEEQEGFESFVINNLRNPFIAQLSPDGVTLGDYVVQIVNNVKFQKFGYKSTVSLTLEVYMGR